MKPIAHTLLALALVTACRAADAPPAGILLITSPELAPAWKPFADWKTNLGKPTTIVTTAAIAKSSGGPDIQEKIRRRIRKGIDQDGIRWVILGGDSQPGGKGHVPDRDTFHKTRWGTNTDTPTDIYYLGRDNWDADGDGVYGEWKDDRKAIDYPDGSVGLGRIPVRSADDVAAYTAKVIAYESKYPTNGFATTFTYTCPERGAYPKLRTSWSEVVSKAWPAGTAHWFLTGRVSLGDDQPAGYPLSPPNWVKLVNARSCGKLHMHGHGLRDCWILEKHDKLTSKHLAQLENENAYPAITTVSCFTGHYDAAKDPCIAESTLRLPNAGAILVVCPSREGKPHFLNPAEDFRLMMTKGKRDGTTGTMAGFWQQSLGKDRKPAGQALMSIKASMVPKARQSASFHLCLCELNLLGDPTLDLRASAPKTPKLNLPDSVTPGAQTIRIQTNSPGATVCLRMGGQLCATAITDDQGACQVPVHPKKPGTIRVTVSGPDLNVFSRELPVRARD